MAEPFKNLINRETVEAAGHHLHRAWPAFPRARFDALALDDLDALEMKARAMRIADALQATLPADFDHAARVIEASLAPPIPVDRPASASPAAHGLAGWVVWSLGEFVTRTALADPARVPRALTALHALTQRFSAEFAIRPLIRDHPATVFETLSRWVHDPSAHVRRLVSEGSRPRLPWGLRLQSLVDDPTPTLAWLRALQDDPSEYVRRSVANHLNDIAKDHPALIADWLDTHLPDAPDPRRALLRHASRTLIKQGDPRVLRAWGIAGAFEGESGLRLAPRRIRIGESVTLQVTLRSRATVPQALVVDYAVHHVKADGGRTPKVFKGWSLTLAPGERRALERRHSMRPVTTRVYRPGEHRVELRVNGHTVAHADFALGPAA